MKMYKINLIILLALGVFINSCADLEIENFNEPNFDDVLASPQDLINVPGGAFVSWWQAQSTVNTGTAWAANADMLTCSWGNFGIRNFSWQPPLAIDNSLTSNDAAAISTAYSNYYNAVSSGIDIERFLSVPENLPVIVNGVDQTAMLDAVSKFLIGSGHAQISILYDRGFTADSETDLGTLNGEAFVTSAEMRDFGVSKLEEAASIASSNTFSLPANYLNGLELTSTQFAELANHIAAMALAYHPRNPGEVGDVDWAKVVTLTNNGLSYDFAPLGDNNLWFDDVKGIGGGALANGVAANTWARVDQKVLNLMDPNYPSEFPADGASLPELTTDDDRISTDFLYRSSIFFPIDRGTYRFSNYVHNRYIPNAYDFAGVPMPKFLKAEGDLIRAEALIRSGGDKGEAATLINNTRVGRGGLTPLTAADSDTDMLAAVKYERIIELLNTWGGRELAEARRWDGWLREGAFRQLPVPGGELTVLGVEIYTFGGLEASN